jgi:uncharacterized protein YjeT (DUF2065 family)
MSPIIMLSTLAAALALMLTLAGSDSSVNPREWRQRTVQPSR